jgi:23S rRNA pseudouridine955/2504/2580 synthase
LAFGDEVRIPPVRVSEAGPGPSASLRKVQALDEAILLETDAWLVVNKPAGMAVHGGSGLSYGVIEALRALRPNAPFLELVHRLDRYTSGCLLVAKKRSALRRFHEALRERDEMDKTYQALVLGRWSKRKQLVNVPLQRNELKSGERIVRVDEEGKESQTRFRVLEAFSSCTLVEAMPLTGRTHQIRVHALHEGHPLLGDEKYGNDEERALSRQLQLKRLFLHAAALEFVDPVSGATQRVEAPLPEELQQVLRAARQQISTTNTEPSADPS